MLASTDARHLEIHDCPGDLPLELHVYLILEDGRVLDAEGVRTQQQMLRSFGIRRGWTHEIHQDVGLHCMGKPRQDLVDALAMRLEDPGWSPGKAPEAGKARRSWRSIDKRADKRWPRRDAGRELPPGAGELACRQWPDGYLTLPGLDRPVAMMLGETSFHALVRSPGGSAHIQELISGNLDDKPHLAMLMRARAEDGRTPLHVLADTLRGLDDEDCDQVEAMQECLLGAISLSWTSPHKWGDDPLMCRDHDGRTAADAITQASKEKTMPSFGHGAAPFWKHMEPLVQACDIQQSTLPRSSRARPRKRF